MQSIFARTTRFFQLFKQAVMGGEQDFTTGSLNRAIFLLSVPMILEMMMESVFAVVDTYFVSRISVDAVATVGLTESVLTIIYSIAMGLSMGATALVARRIGEKNPQAASETAMQAIYIGLGFGLVISVVGFFFSEDILSLMGASPNVIAHGVGYTRWMLGGNLVIMMLFLNNGIFRGAGNAAIAMRALGIANLLNILLCPLLIFGWGAFPGYGVEGAAIATVIGRGCGVIYQFYYLLHGKGMIHLSARYRQVNKEIIGRMLKIASGTAGQFLISSASWVFLVRIMSRFGDEALAGYTIGMRVIVFAILPAWGLSNAAATLVGQNLGAGHPERAEKSVWHTAFYNMVFLGIVSILFWFGAEHIIRIFTHEPQVITYGVMCLRYVCLGYVFYAYGMVIIQSFNGAGDSKTPTVLNLFGFWAFQIPLAYALAIYYDLGPLGVFLAISIAESAMAVAGILLFRRGKWKMIKV